MRKVSGALRRTTALGTAVALALSLTGAAWAKKPAPRSVAPFTLPAPTAWPNPSGRYAIEPASGVVTSGLVLQPNGRYDWFMAVPSGTLESHGVWQADPQQGLLTLSTDPVPNQVPFVLLGSAPADPLPMGDGDLHLRVARFAASSVENDQPVPNAHVVCAGLLRTVETVTDAHGWANCRGTGLPLHRLTLSLDGLPNTGVFDNPRMNGRTWAVGFDLATARNPLVFQGEAWWQQDDGSLMWQPRALPQAPVWTYRPD